jgi:hypothetical protein
MKRAFRPPASELLFDDAPLESILYDVPGTGPTPASLFLASNARMAAAVEAFRQSDVDGGFAHMRTMVAGDEPLSTRAIFTCVGLIGSRVPMIPYPILPEDGQPYDAILEPLLVASLAYDDDVAADVGQALYRFYEGCDRFADAARVVGVLLERARRTGKSADEALLTNNLGYEHLLAREWARAEPLFARAAELFAEERLEVEVTNVRANLLVCRFEQSGGPPSRRLERELSQFLKSIRYDWRRRKVLGLLARCAECRGDLPAAIDRARQAVEAAANRPTRHRLDDQAYLRHLEELQGERGRDAVGPADGPRDRA